MSNPSKKLTPAPGYPDLLVAASPASDSDLYVTHIGFPEDLIAAGVVTAEMLERPGKKGAGNGRVDPDGFRFFLERYFVTRDGQPVLRCRVRRLEVPVPTALKLPGVAEALEAHARHEKDLDERETECQRQEAKRSAAVVAHQPEVVAGPRGKYGHLRLIVDNTRETRT